MTSVLKRVVKSSATLLGGSLLALGLSTQPAAAIDDCALSSTVECIIRTQTFAYDPATGLMTAKASEFAVGAIPDDLEHSLLTTYTRDPFGNQAGSTTSTGAGTAQIWFEARTSGVGYDTRGRFALTATNAMGHVESRTFDGKTGAPLTLTGPNGLTTTLSYDGFGRKILETRADGTKTKWTYGYCTAVPVGIEACPTNATTLAASYQLDTNNVKMSAQAVSYFDRLGREIRVTSEGMSTKGTPAVTAVDTIYDAAGRVLKKSEAFFISSDPEVNTDRSAIVWRAYEFEALGRVKTEFHSVLGDDTNGKKRVSFTYEGLTKTAVTSRDDDIISGLQARMAAPTTETRITRINSQGQEVEITDSRGGKTNFAYDPQGRLTQTVVTAEDATFTSVSITTNISYDKLGNKIAMIDPDKGAWSYISDPLGQLRQQIDAKGNKTDIYYDKIGRVQAKVLSRSDTTVERTDYWAYDIGDKAIGKLVATASVDGNNTVIAQRNFAFDLQGRLWFAYQAFDGSASREQQATYDTATGRLAEVRYPSGLRLGYEYNAIGETVKVKNLATNLAYWTAEKRNAAGQLVQSLAGNGVRTTKAYAPSRGFLTGISSVNASGQSIQDLQYGWDNLGNMLFRKVDYLEVDGTALQGYREDFDYDELNRLSGSEIISGPVAAVPGVGPIEIKYDGFGNIISKSDKGTYGYNFAAGQKPHAVAEVVGTDGVNTESYQYDPNGNMTLSVLNGGNTVVRSVSWTGFNQPLSIKRGGNLGLDFAYDGDQSRYKQVNNLQNGQVKYYYGDAMGNNRSERMVTAGDAVWTDQVLIGGEMVATVVTPESNMLQEVRYMHTDHLGSIRAVTDSMGVKIESFDYDAWGARRSGGAVIGVTATGLQGQPDIGQAIAGKKTDRGFTGHEMLDDVGLVHMNGRIYDAQLARFLAADEFVQDPEDSQTFSRYSYVRNSPLIATDPSGWMENAQVEEGPSSGSTSEGGGGYQNNGAHEQTHSAGVAELAKEIEEQRIQNLMNDPINGVNALTPADRAWAQQQKERYEFGRIGIRGGQYEQQIAVMVELMTYPVEQYKSMAKAGISVDIVAKSIQDYIDLQISRGLPVDHFFKNPDGTPVNVDWSQIAGVFDERNKTVALAMGATAIAHGSADLMKHEFGHAYDASKGWASLKGDFNAIHSANIDQFKAALPREYLKDPKEAFAEALAGYQGNGMMGQPGLQTHSIDDIPGLRDYFDNIFR